MRKTITSSLLLLLLMLPAGIAPAAFAQDAEEVIRVRTRVVFLDALVRDKRTSNLVSDLTVENFEVLADGRPRQISYFSREGDKERRPLALVLVLDLNRIGAGRYLRRTDILDAMAAELAKLPPQDEVAVLALDVHGFRRREWLTPFTNDRAKIAAALARVPQLIPEKPPNMPDEEHPENGPPRPGDDNNAEKKEGTGELRTVDKDGVQTIKYLNKHGVLVINTVQKDGSQSQEIDYSFQFGSAVHDALFQTMADRPASQGAIVWLSDGISPVEFDARDASTASLIQANFIFSALTTDMKFGFKLVKPILKPLGNKLGVSIYNTSQRVARETGGEAVRVRRPEDYARGLSKIIGNLTGRYSLGFTLEETEHDDGQMHQLEVRVRARDAKGKERKLQVTSRRGYFMPTDTQTAQKEVNKN